MKKYGKKIDRRYNEQYSINKKPYFVVTCITIITILILLVIAITVTRNDYKKSQTLLIDQSSETIISDIDSTQNDSVNENTGSITESSEPVVSQITDGHSVLNFTGQVKDWRLMLANRMNIIDDYTPNIKSIGTQHCQNGDDYEVDERIYDDLIAMINAAADDGVKLVAVSAYRTYEFQQKLYDRKVQYYIDQGYSKSGAENKAGTIVAVPGTSDHSLGLAVDFNYLEQHYENTKELMWLKENAEEYGFVMRYAKDKETLTGVIYEPWHYRYVGKENAKIMNDKNMCLEEYVQYLTKNS